jgi:hypothetical protein
VLLDGPAVSFSSNHRFDISTLLSPNNSCELVLDSRGPKNMATLQVLFIQHNFLSERRRWWDLLPGFLRQTKVLHHLTWGIFLHRDLSHTLNSTQA